MTTSREGRPSAPARGDGVASLVARIRESVLSHELAPGAQLRQEEMARMLGVSRVPLREALRVLATEGLLTHRPHSGYFVSELDYRELDQIHALLGFLEIELMGSMRWPTGDEVARMRSLNEAFTQAAGSGDFAAANRLNRELHLSMFSLSPLAILRAETERYWVLSDPYRLLHVSNTDATLASEQHEQLIDAMAAEDRALCLRTLSQHRNETHFAVLQHLRGSVVTPTGDLSGTEPSGSTPNSATLLAVSTPKDI